MGSLRERSPGHWELRVYPAISRTFHGTQREAKRELARLEVEAADQRAPAAGQGTVGELLEQWWTIKPWRSERSKQQAREDIDQYLAPRLGPTRLVRLTHDDIDALYQGMLSGKLSLSGRPLAPGTVARKHATLHAALEWGVMKGKLGRNPAARASAPVDPPTKVRAPERAEVLALINAATAPFDFFVLLAAGTGRRRGDLLALTVGGLDLDEGTMTVVNDKNGRSVRLSLSPSLIERAAAHLKVLAEQAEFLGRPLTRSSFVFSDDGGLTAWRGDSTTRKFRLLAEKVGAPDLNLHGLRHFHATELLGAGVDVETVAFRLGDDPRTILRTYSHFRPARDAAVATLWERIMTEGSERESRIPS